jgi:hypothetical protein
LVFENRVKLPPIVVRNAVAVQRDQRSVDQHYKQNSLRMKLPPQLSTPCAWTVHPHEGGLACLPWVLERGGGGRSNSQIMVYGAVAVQ